MSLVGAIIASTVITAAATSAYGAKQGRKRAKEQREAQGLRDLIEGAAPNISQVEEIMAEDIGRENEAILEDALSQMDYQTQQAQEGADFAAETQMDERLQQLIQQGLPPEFLEQQGAAAMARGGPIGTPNDTYYFDVGNIMNMMTDANPQIQGVGMQLAEQMTANPGMSMVPATRDQIQGMAYGGQVEPRKLAYGDVVESDGNGLGLEEILRQILPADKDRMVVDKYSPEGELLGKSITYSSSEKGDPLVSDARKSADFYQEIMNLPREQKAQPLTGVGKMGTLSSAGRRLEAIKDSYRKQAEIKAREEGSAPMGKELSDADLRRFLPTRSQ
tara:strand:- start:4120 stop:5118 length:999 start_codon:yes stop_codon:yes gene_type:complete